MKWWKSKIKQTQPSIQSDTELKSKFYQDSIGQITGDFDVDLEHVKQEIGHNSDVHFREFNIGRTGIRAAIIFVDGLSDKDLIDKHIMKSLMLNFCEEYKQETPYVRGTFSKEFIKNQVLSISEVEEVHHIKALMTKVLTGLTALLIDGSSDVFILGTTKANKRNIEEPVSEALVRGGRFH